MWVNIFLLHVMMPAICLLKHSLTYLVKFQATVYYIRKSDSDISNVDTLIPRTVGFAKKTEKEVLAENLLAFPAWVAFPDFSRAEWINDLLRYTFIRDVLEIPAYLRAPVV